MELLLFAGLIKSDGFLRITPGIMHPKGKQGGKELRDPLNDFILDETSCALDILKAPKAGMAAAKKITDAVRQLDKCVLQDNLGTLTAIGFFTNPEALLAFPKR